MSLPEKVVLARKKKGLTQEELADLTQLTVRTIQRIESGDTTPRTYTVKMLAAALDTTFEALQATDILPPAPIDKDHNTATLHDKDHAQHFLQMLCLSCFSYLLLPVVHFLVPLFLLQKHKEHDQVVIAYARSIVRTQILWVVALNLLFLLTLAYNLAGNALFGAAKSITYLIPFLAMYLLNALIIYRAMLRSKTIYPSAHSFYK